MPGAKFPCPTLGFFLLSAAHDPRDSLTDTASYATWPSLAVSRLVWVGRSAIATQA